MTNIFDALKEVPIVPLIQADDPEIALDTAQSLAEGGLTVIEVLFRTPAAADCLAAIASRGDEFIVGAGTIMNVQQAQIAIDNGAEFVVSPGLSETVVRYCTERGITVFPGIMTPSEAANALSLGLSCVKFFPAVIAGGVPALKEFGSVFGDLQFMPSGGISASNLADYLQLPSVLACGATWLTPEKAITNRDFNALTRLAREALAIANSVIR